MGFFMKLKLLVWKNFVLQRRHKRQTVFEILAPVLFSAIIILLRTLVDPEVIPPATYPPFSPSKFNFSTGIFKNISLPNSNFSLAVSPDTEFTKKVVKDAINKMADENLNDFFKLFFDPDMLPEPVGFQTAKEMAAELSKPKAINHYLLGVQFDDKLINETTWPDDIEVTLRFPAVMRIPMVGHPLELSWRTARLYPLFAVPGSRHHEDMYGGDKPGYYREVFLGMQHTLSQSLIEAKTGKPLKLNVMLQRYPHLTFRNDIFLPALELFLSLIIALSFVYTAENTVRDVTYEKELQLKETMVIMGLPYSLHWLGWYIKQLCFISISVFIMTVMFKVPFKAMADGQGYAVVTFTPYSVLFFVLMVFVLASLAFCFMVSVFFNNANTAASFMGLAWFTTYSIYSLTKTTLVQMSWGSKMMLCLISNTAMGFLVQMLVTCDGSTTGLQWNNMFDPISYHETFHPGHVILMLLFDTVLYMTIALYVEKIRPGSYGVPQPWYFPFTRDFWMPRPRVNEVKTPALNDTDALLKVVHEEEPEGLTVGVDIRNISKTYKRQRKAVDRMNLKMYENEITVLLGHNGAGKTTIISMLTGTIPPTSGTAYINGYDIVKDTGMARKAIGICPQHNVLFPELTVAEHIYFYGKLKGVPEESIGEEVDHYVKVLQLEHKRDTMSSQLSGGQQRRLSVGAALCGRARVVLLDEPSAGLDPASRRALWDLLLREKTGRTIILTTHFMDEAEVLGDRIAIMSKGKLQCVGTPYFLKKHYGIGYKLSIVKEDMFNTHRVNTFLSDLGLDAKLNSDIGSVVTYTLPKDQTSKYSGMLKTLEEKKSSLRISSYGLSLTTLEEVFMKVGAEDSKYVEEDQISTKTPNTPIANNIGPISQSNAPAILKVASETRTNQDFEEDLDVSRSKTSTSLEARTSQKTLKPEENSVIKDIPDKKQQDMNKNDIIDDSSPSSSKPTSTLPDSSSKKDQNTASKSPSAELRIASDNRSLKQQWINNDESKISGESLPITSQKLKESKEIQGPTVNKTDDHNTHLLAHAASEKIIDQQELIPMSHKPLKITNGSRPGSQKKQVSDTKLDDVSRSSQPVDGQRNGFKSSVTDIKSADEKSKQSVSKQENGNRVTNHLNGDDKKCQDYYNYDDFLKTRDVKGWVLQRNHLKAMFLKLYYHSIRSKLLAILQIVSPIINICISATVAKSWKYLHQQPPLTLSVESGFTNTETVVSINSSATDLERATYKTYYDLLKQSTYPGLSVNDIGTDDISAYYLNKSKILPQYVHYAMPIGASFGPVESGAANVTGWFGNYGYHDSAMSLATVYDAIMRTLAPNSSLTIVNHPLPYAIEDLVKVMSTGGTFGFQFAVNIGMCLSFIASFLVLFAVTERVSGARLLQRIAGVTPATLWGAAYLWDLAWLVIIDVIIVITAAAFQQITISTPPELARVFLVLLVFSISIIPVHYLCSLMFSSAAAGFTKMCFINCLSGAIPFLLMEVLKMPKYGNAKLAKIFDAIFAALPVYSLIQCFRELSSTSFALQACDAICAKHSDPSKCSREQLCSKLNLTVCCMTDDPYMKWSSPGIGRYLFALLIVGLISFVLLLCIEYQVFRKLSPFRRRRRRRISHSAPQPEDQDVAAEKTRLDNVAAEQRALYVLLCRHLSKNYGECRAVDDISFGVSSAECFGLLGINGAGKTTTFKMLIGDVPISSGEVFVQGHSIKTQLRQVYQHIGYCPQFEALLKNLTARETMRIFCLIKGIPDDVGARRADQLARSLGFQQHFDKLIDQLSGGTKRKISTAVALLGHAPLVILDEPTTGMDPASKRLVWRAVRSAAADGRAVVLTSHSMEECEALCTKLTIMVNGQFQCLGALQHLKNKFSQGYTIVVKSKPGPDREENIEILKAHMAEKFGATLTETYLGISSFFVSDVQLAWWQIFEMMEETAATYPIEDYSVSQTTLEQVFLHLIKKHGLKESDA